MTPFHSHTHAIGHMCSCMMDIEGGKTMADLVSFLKDVNKGDEEEQDAKIQGRHCFCC